MNWEIIKKEYPKAFDRFRTYYLLEVDYLVLDYNNKILRFDTMPFVSISGYIHSFFDRHWIRCNYDLHMLTLSVFFDGNILYLHDVKDNKEEWCPFPNKREWHPLVKESTSNKKTTKLKRIEKAEEILFSKAFELLENKLING